MARIRRAQAKGKKDVKLSKEELAAYQRRLQRMEEEKRRQRREHRVAIPISQLDPGSRKKRQSLEGDSPPRQPSPQLGEDGQPGYPPMGYFPPPASSRARPRSGTATSSRPPSRAATDRERGSSPFTYSYVHRVDHPGAVRHASDPATGRPLSQSPQSLGNSASSARNGASSSSVDPFQYMTAGSRTSYHAGTGAVRNSVLEVADIYASYGSTGGSSRRRSGGDPRDGETSSEEDGAVDDLGGARISGSGSASRGRAGDVVDARLEPVPEPPPARDRTPPPPAKKSSSGHSDVKRKAVAGTTKSGRRKGK
ncbi:hypothetical protein VTK56DRAFT_9155 [Thermocarpiscus australiensis]